MAIFVDDESDTTEDVAEITDITVKVTIDDSHVPELEETKPKTIGNLQMFVCSVIKLLGN